MDNQHRKITGYRDLSQAEIDLMNKIKQKGVELDELVAELVDHVSTQYSACDPNSVVYNSDERRAAMYAEKQRLDRADPKSWLMNGKGSLQVGVMMLVRAVAQPTTF